MRGRKSTAGSVALAIQDYKRKLRDQRAVIRDLRLECRSLRVQLYAHETYAKRYQDKQREAGR